MKKKILSSILSLCMIVMLLPAITLRASAVYTGGSNVVRTTTLDLTSANADSSSAAEGWRWVQSTKTLILNGVTIQTPSSASGSSYGIELPAGSTITLAGGSINVVSAGDVTESSSGIFFDATSAGTDTINGTGQLFVSGGGTTGVGCSSAGIFTSGTSSLSIADGTVIASSGKASDFSEAIGVHGQLTISNATITATGGLAANSRGIQSDANSITITGGTVTAVGGTATTESIGIIASSSINISNANVNATGGAVTGTTTGTTSSGIWANSVVTISGGKVIATGGSANYRSHGIYGGGSCYFNGGISIARSGIATTLSNAVYASSGFVTFSGTALAAGAINGKYALVVPDTSTLIAAAKTTMLDLSGASADISSAAEGWAWVQSTSTLTLSGVNINASGDTGIKLPAGATIVLADGSVNVIKAGDSTYSYGIYAAGALTINGNGVLTAISGISSCNTWIDLDGSKGVASTAELTIGAVGSPVITAIGGTATDADSMGIYSDEDITITSGTITAVGGTAYCNSYGMIGYNFLSPKNIKITGGTVTATGGATSGFSSYGISSSGNTTIQGGTTYAMGGTAPNTNAWSTGIYSNKDFTISTGVVIATNGYATNRYANFVGGAFTQEGGQVIAISGAADGSGASHSEGIFGRNSCAFNGGTARAYSGTANWSTPVYAETDYAITFSSSVPTYITMPVGGGVSSNGRTIVTAVGGATESTAVRIESVLPTYMMSASALTEFDSQAAGYAAPTAQTVIITNTGNQIITLAQPTSTNYTIGALSASSIAALGTATFTVQPKTGLTVGKYNEDINIAGNGGASTSVSAKFEVTAATTNALTISGGGTGATAGGSYASGANVSISAGTKTGSTFNGWTSSGGGAFANASLASTAFTMPSGTVTITANWTPTVTITVITPSNDASVVVGGTSQTAGTSASSTNADGQTVKTITLDTDKLNKIIDNAASGANVIIPVPGGSDVAAGVLTGAMIKSMEAKDSTLEIKTDSASYTLPASEINIDSVSQQFGQAVSLSDIKVKIQIAEPSSDMVSVTKNAASTGEFTLVVPAVEYTISCTYGSQTVDVSRFNSYVERTIAIPDGVDPAKITTGVVVSADGTVRHVPTKITLINGKYYAVINSLTNSTYTVIYNPVEFSDVTSHWAKSSINDMGSRMIISGVGNNNFDPDRDITRAEFAAIAVKALGLTPGIGDKTFSDVTNTDWYSPYIKTAASSGLVTGFAGGSFAPNDKITREQAMTIIARAMKLTGLSVSLTDSDISTLLAGYTDGSSASDFAKNSIVTCIKSGIVTGTSKSTLSPKTFVTRAEVAVMVQRLLQKSDLI